MNALRTAPFPEQPLTGHDYREEMIRQAAYFRAQERRRSCLELEVDDWLAAEKDVDGMMTLRPRRP